MTTTGQPAASAEAGSPPSTEKAKGKLLAANIATGPDTMMAMSNGDSEARWTTAFGSSLTTTRSVSPDSADRTWLGAVGVITTLLERRPLRADMAFVCGPEVMMSASTRALVNLGVPSDRIYVSLERNMHCGIAHCGRCQLGPLLLCRDGAVVRWDRAAELVGVRG